MPQGFERRSDVFVCAHMVLPGAQGKNREPGATSRVRQQAGFL